MSVSDTSLQRYQSHKKARRPAMPTPKHGQHKRLLIVELHNKQGRYGTRPIGASFGRVHPSHSDCKGHCNYCCLHAKKHWESLLKLTCCCCCFCAAVLRWQIYTTDEHRKNKNETKATGCCAAAKQLGEVPKFVHSKTHKKLLPIKQFLSTTITSTSSQQQQYGSTESSRGFQKLLAGTSFTWNALKLLEHP